MKAALFLTGVVLLGFAGTLGANHVPDHPGPPECYGLVTQYDTPLGTFYTDDRDIVNGEGFWVYQESNGVRGLQRGGQSALLGANDPELCIDAGAPDTLLV